jgi:FlaA1/EpsC-like NDP-sugar epimerase
MSPAIRRLALQRLARLFDLVTVTFTFLVAVAIASGAANWPSVANVLAMRIAIGNMVIFAVYIAFCSAIFSLCGLYRSHRMSHLSRRIREILLAVTLITGMIVVLRGPLGLSFATNEFLLVFWLLLLIVLALAHELAQQLLYYARARGKNLRTIVIVGDWREATDLAERLEKDSNFGYRVLDIIDPGASQR